MAVGTVHSAHAGIPFDLGISDQTSTLPRSDFDWPRLVLLSIRRILVSLWWVWSGGGVVSARPPHHLIQLFEDADRILSRSPPGCGRTGP